MKFEFLIIAFKNGTCVQNKRDAFLPSICSHCHHPFLHSRNKQRESIGRHRRGWWSRVLYRHKRYTEMQELMILRQKVPKLKNHSPFLVYSMANILNHMYILQDCSALYKKRRNLMFLIQIRNFAYYFCAWMVQQTLFILCRFDITVGCALFIHLEWCWISLDRLKAM